MVKHCCLIVGSSPGLVSYVAWSLPRESIDRYYLFGSERLRPLRLAPKCAGIGQGSLADGAALKAFAESLRRKGETLVAIAADEDGARALSSIDSAELFRLPTPTAEHLTRLGNKWNFYQTCLEVGAATPLTLLFKHKSEVQPGDLLARLGDGVVVKPISEGNGLGVAVVRGAEELQRVVLDDPTWDYTPLIAQSFAPGIDIDMSYLAVDGVIRHYAIQTRSNASIDFVANRALRDTVAALTEHTRYTGLAHIDARWDAATGALALIECNPRPWATIGAATWCGLNFVRAAMDVAMDRPATEPYELTDGSCPTGRVRLQALLKAPWRLGTLRPDQRQSLAGAGWDILLRTLQPA